MTAPAVTIAREGASASPVAAVGFDVALLVVAKAVLGAVVLRTGFTHVSDDDFARVVIAEGFAHGPKLDPSGTSWLPLPFWVDGAAMMAFGRSLATARGVAFVLGALSVVPPYLAARAIGLRRIYALVATALAATTPWSAWLGVATVPEAMAASLLGGAMIVSGARALGGARIAWAAGLFAASLSRYEAWPVALGFAAFAAWDAWKGRHRAASLVSAAIALVGPAAWMAWNAHAHGDALHFFARVAAFRQASGAASVPLDAKVMAYPQALVACAPEVIALSAVAAFGLVDPSTRRTWGRPLALGALLLTALIYGDVRDGAPTHHPERAVLSIVVLLAAFGVDGARALARRLAWARPMREMWVVGAVTAAILVMAASFPARLLAYPGAGADDRATQVARGRDLAATAPDGFTVVPCAYEHFALLAAYGAPERVVIGSSRRAPVTPDCPAVSPR